MKEDEAIGDQFMTLEDKTKDLQWEYEEIIANTTGLSFVEIEKL